MIMRSCINDLTHSLLQQYEKNPNSFIVISAVSVVVVVVVPGGGKYIASVFDLPSFLLSPQWTVSP